MERHVCPWYVGYLLASPLRKIFQNPEEILRPHVREGMRILEVGPGMGFFTLPMARMVGEKGRVIAVDVQERMIASLRRRTERAGLGGRIEARTCPETTLGVADLDNSIDVVLAFAVVHEVPDQERLFHELFRALKKGGRMLLAEPRGHVSAGAFEASLAHAGKAGFSILDGGVIPRSLTSLLVK